MAKYSFEEKKAAIDLVLVDGLSQCEVSRITGVTRSHLQVWLNLYSHYGVEGLLMKSRTPYPLAPIVVSSEATI